MTRNNKCTIMNAYIFNNFFLFYDASIGHHERFFTLTFSGLSLFVLLHTGKKCLSYSENLLVRTPINSFLTKKNHKTVGAVEKSVKIKECS